MAFTTNLEPNQVAELKVFISALKGNPDILHAAELRFFRDYIESLGGKIPKPAQSEPKSTPKENNPPPKEEPKEEEKEESEEEEDLPDFVEEDVPEDIISKEGVIVAEDTPLPEMFTSDKEVSEEDMEASNALRSEAIGQMNDGNLDDAVTTFTKALKMNPSAVLYAKRANALLKQKRVKAVIADCDAAIERNPDSALAHKLRGRAYRMLGDWTNSAKDLRKACKLDCDEQAMEWLAEVNPNAKKVEEFQRGQQRKREQHELAQRQQRVRKAKKANEKAYKKAQEEENEFDDDGPGMFGGAGDFLSDLKDPEVAAAFQDIMKNPMNLMKYKDNPKVQKIVELMKGMGGMPGMGGMGGMPGGMGGMPFGGMGGMPGGMGGFPGGMGGGCPGGAGDDKCSSKEGSKGGPTSGASCMDDLD